MLHKVFSVLICGLFTSLMLDIFSTNMLTHGIKQNMQESAVVSMVTNLEVDRTNEDYFLQQEQFKVKFEENFNRYANKNFNYRISYKTNELGASIIVEADTPLGEIDVPLTVIYEEK